MKFTYFYMELGDITIFQPTNIRIEETVHIRPRGLNFASVGSPAISLPDLFFNGDIKEQDFNMCRGTKRQREGIQRTLNQVDQYNEGLNNV